MLADFLLEPSTLCRREDFSRDFATLKFVLLLVDGAVVWSVESLSQLDFGKGIEQLVNVLLIVLCFVFVVNLIYQVHHGPPLAVGLDVIRMIHMIGDHEFLPSLLSRDSVLLIVLVLVFFLVLVLLLFLPFLFLVLLLLLLRKEDFSLT